MLRETTTCSRRKLSQRYASSLSRQLSISPCALMMSILYSERLRQLNPGYLDRVSSSDLYVVSMLVATKFLHDEGEQEEIYNNEWAEAAGLAVSTVNRLEREFLDAMEWNIYVHPNDFLEFCSKIETKIAFKYGLQRGWFSYTDLTQCLLALQYQTVLKDIFEKTVKIIGGCVLVYGMSLSLIISSVITYAATNNAATNSLSNIPTSNLSSFLPPGINKTSIPDTFHTYSERLFTRRRRQSKRLSTKEQHDVKEQYDDVDDQIEVLIGHQDMQRLQNSTDSLQIADLDTFQCGYGTCNTPPSLHSETRFQHPMKQTRLSISLDLKDLQMFYGGRNFESFESPGENGRTTDHCADQDLRNDGKFKKLHDPVRHLFQRKTNNFMYDARVFGMPVI